MGLIWVLMLSCGSGMKITVVWFVTPCTLVHRPLDFEGNYALCMNIQCEECSITVTTVFGVSRTLNDTGNH